MSRKLAKERSASAENYADYEYQLARQSILPVLEKWDVRLEGARLLDVGCGGGGTPEAFHEKGAAVTGLDIEEKWIRLARDRAKARGYDIAYFHADGQNMPREIGDGYDLAIIRDVIEHVEDPGRFLESVLERIRPDGRVFISFPPYYSAFGAHQHHPRAITRFLPWSHIYLPKFLFNRLLPDIPDYREEREQLNRLTISRIEEVFFHLNLPVTHKQLYVIRPSLHFKYKLPIIKAGLLTSRRGIRELMVSGAYYLLRKPAG